MHTTQINHQLVINKKPEVIVTRKVKNLSSLISEAGMHFQGEMIVMRLPFIEEKLIINREETGVIVDIFTPISVKGKYVALGHVIVWCVVVPHVEVGHTVSPVA